MTNKEKYKQAFSVLHASGNDSLEGMEMEKKKSAYLMKKTMAACAAVASVLGSMTVAYAADLGGIQQKITGWLRGEEKELSVRDIGDYSYSYTYTDEDGEAQGFSGGGVEIDDDGNETPMSAEHVLEAIASHEVEKDDDGRVWLYDYDKKVELTDLLKKDGTCKVAVKREGGTDYFTIKDNGDGEYEMQFQGEEPENAEEFLMME